MNLILKSVKREINNNINAKVAYFLQLTIFIPIIFLTIYFIISVLEFQRFFYFGSISTIVGFSIPVSFALSMLAIGVWGMITGIHPLHRYYHYDKKLYGWKSNNHSRLAGAVDLLLASLALYGVWYFWNFQSFPSFLFF